MNIKMKTLIIGKYLGMCELVGESTLNMYKIDVAPLGSVETMEYYNKIGQSVDVVCYTSE